MANPETLSGLAVGLCFFGAIALLRSHRRWPGLFLLGVGVLLVLAFGVGNPRVVNGEVVAVSLVAGGGLGILFRGISGISARAAGADEANRRRWPTGVAGLAGPASALLAASLYTRMESSATVFLSVSLVAAMAAGVAAVGLACGSLGVRFSHGRSFWPKVSGFRGLRGALMVGGMAAPVMVLAVLLSLPSLEAYEWLERFGASGFAGYPLVAVFAVSVFLPMGAFGLQLGHTWLSQAVAVGLTGLSVALLGLAMESVLLVLPGGLVFGGCIRLVTREVERFRLAGPDVQSTI